MKIKLFNSDEMMGEDAFEKLKEQIQQQENVRQNLNQQLSEIKQQRKDFNEKIEMNEVSFKMSSRYTFYRKSLSRY